LPIILHIDASASSLELRLQKDGLVIASYHSKEKNAHAALINVAAEKLCKENGASLQNVDAFAVMSGPGSYTGLRVAYAALKGWCFALNKPLICYNKFELLHTAAVQQNLPLKQAAFVWQPRIGEVIMCDIANVITLQNVGDVQNLLEVKLLYSDSKNPIADIATEVIAVNDLAFALLANQKFTNKEFADIISAEPFYGKKVHIITPKPISAH
jgi:tRNA threonylcarbamoyl adenosine modification protein YeaZ